MERKNTLPRRTLLRNMSIVFAGALGLGELGLDAAILKRVVDAITLSHNLPNIEKRQPTHLMADYGDLSETVPIVGEGKDRSHFLGQGVFGDSLAFGFVENYDRRMVLQASQLSPADIFCNDLMGSHIADAKGVPHTFWDLIQAYPGASFSNIEKQIDTFASEFKPGAEVIPYDFIFAIGGNYALDWFNRIMTSIEAVNVVNDFRALFLPQFQYQMEVLLEKIISLRQLGAAVGDIKHIFVTGIPNIGKSDALFIPTGGVKDPVREINIGAIPGARGLATAICTRMNATMIDAIEAVQQRHSDIPILFENISDVPVHGIHPTEEGYRIIARRREERCRAKFTKVNGLPKGSDERYGYSTFRDVVIQSGAAQSVVTNPTPLQY